MSQRYTPTQRFTQYPPPSSGHHHLSWDEEKEEEEEDVVLQLIDVKFFVFFIHQMDELDRENFNFEQFYQLYLKVCGRLEIEHLCFKW